MSINENMPNFNRTNPFVIQCSHSYDDLMDANISFTREFIMTIAIEIILICIQISILTFNQIFPNLLPISHLTLSWSFISLVETFIWIFPYGLVLLGTTVGIGFLYRNLCVRTPYVVECRKMMDSSVSEVSVMNYEEVLNATIRLQSILGKSSVLRILLSILKVMSFSVVGIYTTVTFLSIFISIFTTGG